MAVTMDTSRIICLIDMDCFYVQVEQIAAPEFLGKPCGVCQYNPYKGGGLIAVNYEARKFNVKRGMRGDQAKALCPDFHTFFVNNKRGKADLNKYREASLKIFEIISKHCEAVEKASIDEAYLDLTDQVMTRLRSNKIKSIELSDLTTSFVIGSFAMENSNDREENLKSWLAPISDLQNESNETLLAIGALIVEEIRTDIRNTLGYNCSAGVANSKTLAKLCCGINKPNRQTILPSTSIETLYEKTQINAVKNLGGKLGVILQEELNLKTMSDLAKMEVNDLIRRFGDKTGNWLWQISRGIDTEPVMSRQAAKSIGCSKNFRGKQALNTVNKVSYWIKQLSEELQERLDTDKERNQREANSLVIHITTEAGTFSKTTNISKYCALRFAEQSMELLKQFNKAKNESWQPAIVTLGISASKFVDFTKSTNPLLKYFNTNATKAPENLENLNENSTEPCTSSDLNVSNENNLSDLVETMNTMDNEHNSNSKLSIEKSTSKTSKSNPTETSEQNESNLDADYNFENDDCIVVDDTNENEKNKDKNSNQTSNKPNTSSFFQPVSNIENLEETDYVQCEKCSKKILCWYMPEHEDFHYAQELSKQLSASEKAANVLIEDVNNKKRSLAETPAKNQIEEKNKKTVLPNKSKKLKTENVTKSNTNSIANYFTKKN